MPKVACVMMQKDEAILLEPWLTYHGHLFGLENLFVIDDGSDDGSTTGLGPVRVMRQAKADLDEEARARRMLTWHRFRRI